MDWDRGMKAKGQLCEKNRKNMKDNARKNGEDCEEERIM